MGDLGLDLQDLSPKTICSLPHLSDKVIRMELQALAEKPKVTHANTLVIR